LKPEVVSNPVIVDAVRSSHAVRRVHANLRQTVCLSFVVRGASHMHLGKK
jgi:hypothetical protein